MNPIKTYDYLALARTRIFDWVRPLSPEQYTTRFPIGLGTLARTLTHSMICEWAYMQRIARQPLPPYKQWPIQDENAPAFPDLEQHWIALADRTRAGLAAVTDWTTEFEYTFTDDDGIPQIITVCPSDIFTQLAFHEVHHRAQAMNILRSLGVKAEDLDYNSMMYKRRPA